MKKFNFNLITIALGYRGDYGIAIFNAEYDEGTRSFFGLALNNFCELIQIQILFITISIYLHPNSWWDMEWNKDKLPGWIYEGKYFDIH